MQLFSFHPVPGESHSKTLVFHFATISETKPKAKPTLSFILFAQPCTTCLRKSHGVNWHAYKIPQSRTFHRNQIQFLPENWSWSLSREIPEPFAKRRKLTSFPAVELRQEWIVESCATKKLNAAICCMVSDHSSSTADSHGPAERNPKRWPGNGSAVINHCEPAHWHQWWTIESIDPLTICILVSQVFCHAGCLLGQIGSGQCRSALCATSIDGWSVLVAEQALSFVKVIKT